MKELSYSYERVRLMPGFDGRECKIYPRLVETECATFLSYNMLLLSGSDVFNDSYFVKSTDGGRTFGAPERLRLLEARENGIRTIFAVVTEYYSAYHKKWFVFGHNTSYADDKHPIMVGGISTGEAVFLLRDGESGHFVGEPKPIPLPLAYLSACPHGQVIEYENGDFLLSYYLVPEGETKSTALTVRYRYENGGLSIVEAGEPLAYPAAARGLDEPSVACLGGRYYMTLRTDEQGLLSLSEDGLRFSAPTPWKWDDGSILENYNTMQRWVRHREGLFLIYTRRGAHNDHVFRHRAPLFMARFDEDRLCLIRSSEVILVPELGARLGNFTVTERKDGEIWLLTAEWMQCHPRPFTECAKYGSDNALWIAKLHFEK